MRNSWMLCRTSLGSRGCVSLQQACPDCWALNSWQLRTACPHGYLSILLFPPTSRTLLKASGSSSETRSVSTYWSSPLWSGSFSLHGSSCLRSLRVSFLDFCSQGQNTRVTWAVIKSLINLSWLSLENLLLKPNSKQISTHSGITNLEKHTEI